MNEGKLRRTFKSNNNGGETNFKMKTAYDSIVNHLFSKCLLNLSQNSVLQETKFCMHALNMHSFKTERTATQVMLYLECYLNERNILPSGAQFTTESI